MTNKFTKLLILFTALVWLGCSDDDEVTQPLTINFTNQEAGISSASPSAELIISFSRPASSSGALLLSIAPNNLSYNRNADFYTLPEAANNSISLPYEVGDESVSIEIHAGAALNIQGDETITIHLENVGDNILKGPNASIAINFSENFIAPAGTIELNAGGAEFTAQAFVDLSKLKQTSFHKYSWDLGFYTLAGAHRVILNSSAYTMARPIDKNDLAEVTAQDTLNFAYEMQIPPPNFDPSIGSIDWVDSPDGNLETTAFGTISPTASENKVFIIKRDGGRDWKKVRVLQNGENYTLEYANIDATSYNVVEIQKDAAYNFTFFNFDGGIVSVEPAKDSWDFMYGTFTESLNLGGPGMDIPYGYKDFIIINRHDTKVAMVMTDDVAYADFATDHLADLNFETAIDAFGENWRSGGGPTSGPALYDDRYFIIEDSEGSVFKMDFTRLTSTTGERGYPEFIFERVK